MAHKVVLLSAFQVNGISAILLRKKHICLCFIFHFLAYSALAHALLASICFVSYAVAVFCAAVHRATLDVSELCAGRTTTDDQTTDRQQELSDQNTRLLACAFLIQCAAVAVAKTNGACIMNSYLM